MTVLRDEEKQNFAIEQKGSASMHSSRESSESRMLEFLRIKVLLSTVTPTGRPPKKTAIIVASDQ
jgi:hypothetical protein